MTLGHSFKWGVALAITVGIGYALCTIAFWLFPEASANFMNALFHGLDFRALRSPGAFTWGSFAFGFVVLVAWALFMGSLFGWVADRLGKRA